MDKVFLFNASEKANDECMKIVAEAKSAKQEKGVKFKGATEKDGKWKTVDEIRYDNGAAESRKG